MNNGEVKGMKGMISKGDILWSGRLEWTSNEDSMESIDIPPLPAGDTERCFLAVRNGSATVALVVNIGYMTKCMPAGKAESTVWTFGSSGSNTVFQSTDHRLKVGDALLCLTAGGTNCSAGVIYYVHGADAATAVPADTLYLSLVKTDGGALIDASTAVVGTFEIADEFCSYTSFTVAAWAAGSSTAPIAGFESETVDVWPFGMHGGRLMVEKAAATAGAFNAYCEIRRV